jgi:hypothetical protein
MGASGSYLVIDQGQEQGPVIRSRSSPSRYHANTYARTIPWHKAWHWQVTVLDVGVPAESGKPLTCTFRAG